MTPFDFLRFGAYALLLLGMLAAVGTFVFALYLMALGMWRNARHAELRRQHERRFWEPQQLAPTYPATLNEYDAEPTRTYDGAGNPFLPPTPPAPLPSLPKRVEPGDYPPHPCAGIPFVSHDFPR